MFSFNSLVLIPSDHCNITCRHCAPACGPAPKRAWNVELLRRCLNEAANLPNVGKRVHFAGGEPFLYYPQMLELVRHAKSLGFDISIVTNGFWGKNEARAAMMVAELVDAGLTRVELSTDVFHQEHIPVPTIRRSIQVLKSAGVKIILRVITSRKHTVEETLRQLTVEDLDGLEIAGSPVVPVGRAKEAVPEDEFYLTPYGTHGTCHNMLNLTVRPDWNVAPCCAGSENTPSLWLGNVEDLPLEVIVRNAEWNLMVKKLVFHGPSSFIKVLSESGLDGRIRPAYANVCHLCSELFGDPEAVEAIKSWVIRTQAQPLARLLAEISEMNLSDSL